MTQAAVRPAISIVMPAYKEPIAVLRRTIDSLRGQTFQDFELVVVVDDPGHAEAASMLVRLCEADPRVRAVFNERNLGVWPSYNRGIREARGRYIAIQDADDISLPDRLRRLYAFLQRNPDVDVVGCSLRYIDAETTRPLLTRVYPPVVDDAIRRYCPLAHATTLRKADLHERFGYYDESPRVRHAADYELWCRWHAKGVRMRNIPDVLYEYYQTRSNFKALNVARILDDTIHIKGRYADALGFRATDRLWLWAERIVSHAPPAIIVALFYAFNRLRSSSGHVPEGCGEGSGEIQ